MTAKQTWDGLAARILSHLDTNGRDSADEAWSMPASNYLDPQRWSREINEIFRKQPLALAFSTQLGEPDSYLAVSRVGRAGAMAKSTLSSTSAAIAAPW